jgi:hypothetical protein
MTQQAKPDIDTDVRKHEEADHPTGLVLSYAYGDGGGYARQSDCVAEADEAVPEVSDSI